MSAGRETVLPRNESLFFLFVYGTLKCGFSNHDKFCGEALRIEEASVHGDLYDLPFGFPALVVPEDTIRATGTPDPIQDAAIQRQLNESPTTFSRSDSPHAFGELMTFEDPGVRLPRLDHLEGFDPEGHSLYRRVLIPTQIETGRVLAWAYIIEKPTGTYLPGGRWPS